MQLTSWCLAAIAAVADAAGLADDRGAAACASRRTGGCQRPSSQPRLAASGAVEPAVARESLLLQLGTGRVSLSARASVVGAADGAAAAAEAAAAAGRVPGGTGCHTSVEGEPCHAHVRWSMDNGIMQNPSWYTGLSSSSSFEAFQMLLHQMQDFDCPRPCGAPLEGLDAVMQQDAVIAASGKLSFYTIGSSNVVWETWPDQLHAMLRRLGYTVRGRDDASQLMVAAAMDRPVNVPVCDDAAAYAGLSTPRVGRVGWASWGFAYESKDDCGANGFRRIAGHNVSCSNAWACDHPGMAPEALVRPSQVAEEARHAHVVLVSNWINDSRQHFALNKCYGGENIDSVATTDITVENLRRLIRAIHARNPKARVLVMARYPGAAGVAVNSGDLARIAAINAAVERQITATEPNTFFVNYAFPAGEEMFQTKNFGHPNCRGDKVMATAALEALFRHRIISKGLALGDEELCLGSKDCGLLSLSCCQRSALCHVAANSTCLPYGPGKQ